MSLRQTIEDNINELLAAGILYVAYVEGTDATYPDLSFEGQTAVLLGGLAAVGVGYVAAEAIYGLLPDDEGIYIVEFRASDETGGAVYEVTEDQFSNMEVVAGQLFQWPVSKRVYECREYRPEDNVCVANWRESVAASELAGDTLVADAMEGIAEIREEFEPEARKYRLLQRRLRGVVRKLDRRRLEDQQSILDSHTNPELAGEGGATVAQVLQEEIPEDLRPQSMEFDEKAVNDSENGHKDEPEEFAGFDLLDENEPLEPETHE